MDSDPARVASRRLVAVSAAALALFAFAAWSVAEGRGLARLDATAHAALATAPGSDGRAAAWAATWFGNHATVTALVVLAVAALLVARHRALAARVAVASGLGGPVLVGLKALFARARPAGGAVEATGFSFPSGHAWAATVLYGMLVYLVWRLTPNPAWRAAAALVAAVLVVAVGLSRVVLNVHYLSDVVAGWAAGAAWLAGVLALADALERRAASRRMASRRVA